MGIHQETRAAYWIPGLSPPLLALLALPALYVPFAAPLLSLRTRRSGTSALCRRREPCVPRRSHGRRVAFARLLFLDGADYTRRWICLPFVCAWNVDDRVRITSGGANPCFMPDLPIRLRRRVDASGPGRRRKAFFCFFFFCFLSGREQSNSGMHAHTFPSDSWTE